MEYTTLGRTGLRASVMGLGAGGNSRLGLRTGKTEEEARHLIHRALSLGVNVIDTAEGYGTEELIGEALAGPLRDTVILATKAGVDSGEGRSTGADLKARAEACLKRLRTDHVDIFQLHAVRVEQYAYAREELVPALLELRDEGKIRFVGITESFMSNATHATFMLATEDDCWDVMMTGFNILNQTARERVFAKTREKNIGVLDMFAVRTALSDPIRLRKVMSDLVERGLVDPAAFDPTDPLGFLIADGAALSIPDAGYRFCRHEPGVHVVLSGTGNLDHLAENAASLCRPPLPEHLTARLRELFRGIDCVSGD